MEPTTPLSQLEMQNRSPLLFLLALLLLQTSLTFGQKNEPTTGPVFNDIGAVFSIDNLDNPNRDLIKTLSNIGVDVFLCGQSMSSMGYSKEDLLPEVKVALSAMTVLTVYQMNNYALIKF